MLNRLFGSMSGGNSGAENVHMVSPKLILEWLQAEQVVLIDVREPDEFRAERIAGAINLPLSTFDPAQLPEVPEGKKLVLHCRSGQRCGMATARLLAAGYGGEINRMEGGIMGWRALGCPVD